MRKFLFLTFLIGLSRYSDAQHPYYYCINDEIGLPSNEVYCVLQDTAGFMWIGCEAGLYRYDGVSFKSYTNKKQNAKAISSLQFDKTGKLWCQNFAGQIYTVQNDSLVIYFDAQQKIKGHPAFDVDDKQNLFVGLPEGILKISPDHSEKLLYKNQIFAGELKVLEDGNMFVFSKDGNFYTLNETEILSESTFEAISKPDVCWVDKRPSHGLVLYSNNREQKYHLTSHFKHLPETYSSALDFIPPTVMYYTAYDMVNGERWFTTSIGVFLIQNGKYQHLFPGEKISNLFLDREGNYWFTSLENGIYVIPEKSISILDKSNSKLSDQNISSLLKLGENQLLIGTFGGSIFEYNLVNDSIRLLPQNSTARYRSVSVMLQDQEGVLASRSNLSHFDFDLKQERATQFNYLRDVELIDDRLYYASAEGMGYLKYDQNNFQEIPSSNQFISNLSCRQLQYDSVYQTLWVGQSAGLAYLTKDSLTLFLDDKTLVYPTGLTYGDSILWVGTIDNGVIGIANQKVKYRFNESNILRGNSVSAIYANDEFLIVSTNECVNIIYFRERRIECLDLTDGINTKDINAILADENYLFLGSTKGLYSIPLETISQNVIRPQILIEKIFVNQEKQTDLTRVNLNYRDELRIQFSAASLRSRGRGSFMYRLNNSASKWNHLEGNIREIYFSSMPSGTYQMELLAVNEDGYFSAQPARLLIYVNAPFWQKWWFYALIIAITLAAVVFIYTLRIRTIRRKSLMQERLIRSQLQTIKAQMNPHFIFNALNSIQDLILQQDHKNSYQYLNKFAQLMRTVLESTEQDEISLADEINFLQLYLDLEKLRFGSEFVYEIKLAKQMDTQRQNLPAMILQPFVENAIKHGLLHKKGDKKLLIEFLETDQEGGLMCLIRDNGIGRKRSVEIKERHQMQHKSFATRATEQRIELLNNRSDYRFEIRVIDLHDEEVATGTEIQILISPVKQNA